MFGRDKSEGKIGRIGQTLLPFAYLRISDKFCQILKEVLPLSALAIQLNYPKTKDKFCRDSQN
jgi:hypothetical protein